MDASRRQFLKYTSLLLGATSFPFKSFGAYDGSGFQRFPSVQGRTDARSTSLLILVPKSPTPFFQVMDLSGQSYSFQTVNDFEVPGTDFVQKEIFVDGLSLRDRYFLKVFTEDGALLDQREFSALDISGSRVTFAAVSCMSDELADVGWKMWDALSAEEPDFVILNGDTVYSDRDNPDHDMAGYGRRYAEARSKLGWYYQPRLTPTLATWDDHDFGMNNGDRHFELGAETKNFFKNFWG
ncbi:MAG: hypothetical protein KDD22_04030, partial [Bdellovibrionales bacterium]|nr:hypothetical protein [Bdellovibrionales bacterium]